LRDTGKIFKLINDPKKVPKNINPYIPIYPDVDVKTENIEFSEKYKIFAERAGRKIVT
jgi:hypothetical protein